MHSKAKWAGLVFAIVAVLAVMLGGASMAVLTGTVPNRAGFAQIEGLAADTTLAQSDTGVVINASNRADALAALGFAHAQDRFWQMHLLRRAARGELSAVLGRNALESDRFARAVDFVGPAEASWRAMSAKHRLLLEAYVRGVNAQRMQSSRSLSLNMPPEALLAGLDMEPWLAQDSLAILRMVTLLLTPNPQPEVRVLQLQAQGLNPREVVDILPRTSNASPLPDLANMLALNRPFADKAKPAEAPFPLGNWLRGDTPLGLAVTKASKGVGVTITQPNLLPSALHKANLAWQDNSMAMLTLPGLPVPLVGKTENVFFSVRTHFLDTVNVRMEQVRGNPPIEVLTPRGWQETLREKQNIAIHRSADETFERVAREDRPFLPPEFGNLNRILTVANGATLDWAGATDDDEGMAALLAITPGRDLASMADRLDRASGVSLAVQFVDQDGKARLVASGAQHVYEPDNPIKGVAPSPGWLVLYDGSETTTSQTRYGLDHRALKGDGGNPLQNWLDLRDVLLDVVRIRPLTRTLLNDLARWQGTEKDPWQPTFLTVWHKHLVSRLLADDLEALRDYPLDGGRSPLIAILGKGSARNWCDDLGTPDVPETCEGRVTAALDAALSEMTERYGETPSTWRWSQTVVANAAPLGTDNGLLSYPFRATTVPTFPPANGLAVDPWSPELVQLQNSDSQLTLDTKSFTATVTQNAGPSGNPFSSRYGRRKKQSVFGGPTGEAENQWLLSPAEPSEIAKTE